MVRVIRGRGGSVFGHGVTSHGLLLGGSQLGGQDLVKGSGREEHGGDEVVNKFDSSTVVEDLNL